MNFLVGKIAAMVLVDSVLYLIVESYTAAFENLCGCYSINLVQSSMVKVKLQNVLPKISVYQISVHYLACLQHAVL